MTTVSLDRERLLAEVQRRARAAHAGDASGHDWWHVVRVTNLARRIAAAEGADPLIVELAALLHDVGSAADRRNHGAVGALAAAAWLAELGVDPGVAETVVEIIRTVSFKSPNQPPPRTLEGRVVQDADRLDAIGAIGIARTFAYGGVHGRPLHDPELDFPETLSAEEYVDNGSATTIAHFYQKLLRLKDLMTTETGRALASERHAYLEAFLDRFYAEWDGRI